MAVKNITPVAIDLNAFPASALTFEAATAAADGFAIDVTGVADNKLVLLFRNEHGSAAKTITIKKGDLLQGVKDSEAKSLAAAAIQVIRIDSGRFKRADGTVIAIPESTDVKICAIALP